MQQDFFKGTVAERISIMIKSPLFLWANIFVCMFSLFLLLDFPVILLTVIGLWRLFAARKDEFATEKMRSAIQLIRTSMVVNFIAMLVQIVFWGLGDVPQGDKQSLLPYIVPYLKMFWPILLVFATGFVACLRCCEVLREPYNKNRAFQLATGSLLLLFLGYLAYIGCLLLPKQNTAGMVVLLVFGGLIALSSLLYGIWLLKYSATEN